MEEAEVAKTGQAGMIFLPGRRAEGDSRVGRLSRHRRAGAPPSGFAGLGSGTGACFVERAPGSPLARKKGPCPVAMRARPAPSSISERDP